MKMRFSHWMMIVAAAVAVAGTVSAADDKAAGDKKEPFKLPDNILVQPVAPSEAPPANPANVVVTVNGRKITEGEIATEISNVLRIVGTQIPPDQQAAARSQLRQRVIDGQIQKILLTSECDAQKITVSDADFTNEVAKLEKRLPEGKTIKDIMANQGMNEAEFRRDFTQEIRIQKLIAKQFDSIKDPSEAELKKFYDENKSRFAQDEMVRARHILIKTEKTDSDEVKKQKKQKAEDLRQQLEKGAKFEDLAKANSDCPSKERGGDLGMFPRGQMVKPFEDAAFSQELNKIGPVVETPFGYHIIQVTERKPAETVPFEKAQDKIKNYLSGRDKQKAVQTYLLGLKEKAKIDYADGATPTAPGLRPPMPLKPEGPAPK